MPSELGLDKHHSIRIGPQKGYPVTKRKLAERPSRSKGRLGKRTKMVREVVKEVAGQAPYERRLMELLRTGREKRALKFAKKKVRHDRSPMNESHAAIPVLLRYLHDVRLPWHESAQICTRSWAVITAASERGTRPPRSCASRGSSSSSISELRPIEFSGAPRAFLPSCRSCWLLALLGLYLLHYPFAFFLQCSFTRSLGSSFKERGSCYD